jgi:ESS family glutamate:Na+ symporter
MFEKSLMPLFGAFGWLSIMLLLGVVLRAKIRFFQKFLFPASIIGGLIGFVLISVGWCNIDYDMFTLFAIHFFTINFISIGLTGTEDARAVPGRTIGRSILRGMTWMACVWAALFCLQGLVSVGVVYGTNLFSKPLFPGLGFLVPSGFAQGPGQAVALSAVWEKGFKIADAVSFGLTFAAVGFLFASLVGVPLANWGIRKGLTLSVPKELPNDFVNGLSEQGRELNAGKLTTHPANIDGLAFQLAILMAVYFLTYYECLFLKAVLPGPLKAISFGLMFMWGMISAVILRFILKKLGLSRYIDNNLQRRITGTAVDYMIVATLMAVKVTAVWNNIVPITLMCIIAGVATIFFMLYFGRRNDEYSFERMIALYGMGTGTAASGLLLLRIVDPEFKTPVAAELGLCNIFLLVLICVSVVMFPLPKLGMTVGLITVAATGVVALVLLKVFKLWGKPVW